ncbi:MAG TPA: phosphatase PAP2 family protein [Luteimonas sp.]|nr:phosphatase PAP2 family protein [Luteimonas sp.]
MAATVNRMHGIVHWLGIAFALQLLAILLLGSVGAWQLRLADLYPCTAVGLVAWLLLARATWTRPGSPWNSWLGTLQFATCWTVFPLFKGIRQGFIQHTADASLLAADRALWGGASLPEHAMAWQSPLLSEICSAGYFLFYFIVLVPAVAYSFRRRGAEARAFFAGLMLMYLAGFVGYLAVPAGGPFIAFPDVFPYPPAGGPMTALLARIVDAGVTGMDVFPSLHAGIGTYVLGFLYTSGRRAWAGVLLPVVAVLVVATVYLLYHYGIDVACGLALAALVLAFVRRYRKEIA